MAWAPSRPGLFPRDEESEQFSGCGRRTGKGGGRVRRTLFHWTKVRPAVRLLRPGASAGPSTPVHRFLCVQLSRETAKNRLKSLGFWNRNTSVFDRGSPLLEREGPERKGGLRSASVWWARALGWGDGVPQGPRALSDTLWPTRSPCLSPPDTKRAPTNPQKRHQMP